MSRVEVLTIDERKEARNKMVSLRLSIEKHKNFLNDKVVPEHLKVPIRKAIMKKIDELGNLQEHLLTSLMIEGNSDE